MVARAGKLLVTDLSRALQLGADDRLRTYTARLMEQGLLVQQGHKKGTRYLISPELVHAAKANVKPTLKTMEDHRLRALVEEDLLRHPRSQFGEVHARLPDVDVRDLRKAVYALVKAGTLHHTPDRGRRRYWLAKTK
jgi:ATP-dependent DNA helicase RecG